MKRFACITLVAAAVGLGGAMFISQPQAMVSGALTALKLESIPPAGGIVGAPPKFKVSKATVDFIQKLEKDKKTIEIQPDGSLQIK